MYDRQRKARFGLFVLSLFSLFLFHSCQDYSLLTDSMLEKQEILRGNDTHELLLAKSYYESHKEVFTPSNVSLSELPVYPYIPHKRSDPSWKYYVVSRNDTLMAVDVDMTDCITQDYIPKQNVEAYRKTGRMDYLRSYTRYVYTLNRKTGEEMAFYMTFVPTVDFVENYNHRIHRVTYLHRDEALSGYVLYHDLGGNFVNGWRYSDGKIVGEILPGHLVYGRDDFKPVLLYRHRSTYSVRLKEDN